MTLDTCCVIDFLERNDKNVKKIIDLYKQSRIDVKVTTRVEFDQRDYKDTEKKVNLINFIQKIGIIATIGGYGVSKFGSGDYFVDEDYISMEKN